jgi:NAD(P)-dependent dehydrogenase (short-subunit alcohol dehydrogenase family)
MNAVLEKFNVNGRSAFVTGGASGIGLAYAEALAEAGMSVTLADIDEAAAARETERLREEGWSVRAQVLDVTDANAVSKAFDDHVAAYGGLDAAFANAGGAFGPGFIDGATGERCPAGEVDGIQIADWHRTVDLLLHGGFYTMREAARVMKAGKKPGSIVATSSNASSRLFPVVPTAYMAAKAAVAHLVRHLALELAPYRIRVNAIAPGSIITNIGGGVLKHAAARDVWARDVPLGHMGETHELKPLALLLASDASSFITGAEMFIDGGVSLGRPV